MKVFGTGKSHKKHSFKKGAEIEVSESVAENLINKGLVTAEKEVKETKKKPAAKKK